MDRKRWNPKETSVSRTKIALNNQSIINNEYGSQSYKLPSESRNRLMTDYLQTLDRWIRRHSLLAPDAGGVAVATICRAARGARSQVGRAAERFLMRQKSSDGAEVRRNDPDEGHIQPPPSGVHHSRLELLTCDAPSGQSRGRSPPAPTRRFILHDNAPAPRGRRGNSNLRCCNTDVVVVRVTFPPNPSL